MEHSQSQKRICLGGPLKPTSQPSKGSSILFHLVFFYSFFFIIFHLNKVNWTRKLYNYPWRPHTIHMRHQVIVSILGVTFQVSAKLLLVTIRPLTHQIPSIPFKARCRQHQLTKEIWLPSPQSFLNPFSTMNAKHTLNQPLSPPHGCGLFIRNQNDVTMKSNPTYKKFTKKKQMYTDWHQSRKKTLIFILSSSIKYDKCLPCIYKV